MIDPLRYYKEDVPTCEVERPTFCTVCLAQKLTKNNPNLATFYCQKCTTVIGDNSEEGSFLCHVCNADLHKFGQNESHVRQILVVGPALRKNVLVRGDGVNFPLPLDTVTIQMKARIYQHGNRIHTVQKSTMNFIVGMSGKCVHVQILGARQIRAGDVTGTSDPFIVYSYCGRPVSSTRVKPTTRNPRWHNETFIVPVEEQMAYPRNMVPSQKDLIKFEVFDHDWITSNDFLGHVEMTRTKLMKLAVMANDQPIRLPLTTKEYHGIVSLQFACDKEFLHVRLVSAEDLDKKDLLSYSNPFAKVFLGEEVLVGTSAVVYNELHPVWKDGNEFKIKMGLVLEAEQYLDSQIRLHKASVGMGGENRRGRQIVSAVSDSFQQFEALPEFLALLRVELYDKRSWRGDSLLGKAVVHIEQIRKMLPDMMTLNEYTLLQERSAVNKSAINSNSKSISKYFFRANSAQHHRARPGSPSHLSTADHSSFNDFTPQASQSACHMCKCILSAFSCSCSARREHNKQENDVESNHMVVYGSHDESSTPSDDRAQQLVNAHNGRSSPDLSRTMSGIKARGAKLKNIVYGKGPEELQWTDLQRYQLNRFSIKSYVHSLGLDGKQDEDYGFLIVRLIVTSHGKIVPGLDEGVRRMTIGETALIKCRYDLAYGNYSLGVKIPPRSNIVFQVRLLDVNGYGKLGLPTRILRRIFRLIAGVFFMIYILFSSLCTSDVEEVEIIDKNGDKKVVKRQMARRWTRFSVFSKRYNLELDADMSSDEEDGGYDEEEEEDEDDGQDEANIENRENDLKNVDHYLRKHMNPAVRAGAKLMWSVEKAEKKRSDDEDFQMLKRIDELKREVKEKRKLLIKMDGDLKGKSESRRGSEEEVEKTLLIEEKEHDGDDGSSLSSHEAKEDEPGEDNAIEGKESDEEDGDDDDEDDQEEVEE